MDPSLANSTPMDLLNVTEDSSPCNLTPMNPLSARDRFHLEREIDDLCMSMSAEQRNSPWIGRPGMMLKNTLFSIAVFIQFFFSMSFFPIRRVFALGFFHVELV